MAMDLEEKKFLDRSTIRTMKKDLAALREADSLKEREKITQIKTSQKPTLPTPVFKQAPEASPIKPAAQPPKSIFDSPVSKPQPAPKNTIAPSFMESVSSLQTDKMPEETPLEKVLQHTTNQEDAAMAGIKQYATEDEKQQIFLLESQRTSLQRQLKTGDKPQESSLILEKNQILIEQKNWQKKLNPIIEEEAKNEAEQKLLEQKEALSNVSGERQNLEKQRWALEDKRKGMEKKRWVIEEKLSELQSQIQNLDQGYLQSNNKEGDIKNQIISIDDSLRLIYADIKEREEAKRKETSAHSVKSEATIIQQQKELQQQRQHERITQIKEKTYIKETPLAARPAFNKSPSAAIEKLVTATKTEEAHRRKFMEDVEKWAAEKNNNDTNK